MSRNRLVPGDDTVALTDGERHWTRAELRREVQAMSERLQRHRTNVLATLLDNSPAWVVADLAAAAAGVVHVPLPVFFTPAQTAHALQAAGVDTVLTLPGLVAAWDGLPQERCESAGQVMTLIRLPATPAVMPAHTAKITFTSGTTGSPKGVCLSASTLQQVADSLQEAMAPLDIGRHLCALPFAVLLENIAGLMAPLSHGATCVTPGLAQVGLQGSSRFDPTIFHAAMVRHQPHSVILLPQMLRVWVAYLSQSGLRAPESLRFVAVGGAAAGMRLLAEARAVGIPAHEGYGLSEGASVQTLNLPWADRPGTAGRALPHARLRVSSRGEIEVSGSLFSGYLGDASPPPTWWPTGDLGHIDADGFVHVEGRCKHVLITAFGRNVSPEWVETSLRGEPVVAQAVVVGDGQPALSAILWPVHEGVPDALLQQAVTAANATLPDYARIHRWTRASAPFTADGGMATANGRPKRDAILAAHAQALDLHDTD